MTDLETQIALEKEMISSGICRYNRLTRTAEDGSRGSETSYANRLMPSLIIDLADAIETAKNPAKKVGIRSKYVSLLQECDSNTAAYITMRVVFDSLMKSTSLSNLTMTIGARIEDQIRFSRFENEHEKYYRRILEDFKRKSTSSYRHRHRVLVKKAREKEDGWIDWSNQERMLVGAKLIELTILSTGIIEKHVRKVGAKKSTAYIAPTEETLEWINEHNAHAQLLHPEVGPCAIPPLDWTDIRSGGYFTTQLSRRVPFIKTRSKKHYEAIKNNDYSRHMDAVNELQRTPWAINTRVHDVMKEVWRMNLRIGMPPSQPIEIPSCPIPADKSVDDLDDFTYEQFMQWKRDAALAYSDERDRVAKSIQLSRVFYMAAKYREYEQFYYVYTCDFRGRIYAASPGLSPQGADFSKGLLHFAQGKELGDGGAYWLAVHGSNVFGYDKDTYDGRYQWVIDNERAILSVAENPLGSDQRSFWSGADKPYQFLAFCFEWAGYRQEGDSFRSQIAVALDGSCNGIQNYSAMLRDRVGGSATNLTHSDKPQDIYQRVADVCLAKLSRSDEELAKQWLAFGISRKLAKKPVMTLPYGSTKQSCRDYIEDYVRGEANKPWEGRELRDAVTFLTDMLWDSIGDVVIAARAAMDWLQRASRILSKENEVLIWHTPTGFMVYQANMQSTATRVKTQLCGRMTLCYTEDTKKIDPKKQSNGVAPNFVHSMDASHLVESVITGRAQGVQNWAMVHDSYGTYASDTPVLARSIREAFVGMYESSNPLEIWKQAQEERTGVELPDLPPIGTLNIDEVLESLYFFG